MISKKQFSSKLTSLQTSFKKNAVYVHRNPLDNGEKTQPKFIWAVLVGTGNWEKVFCRCDTMNWCFHLYTIAKINNGTVLSYYNNNLSERYKKPLLK